MSLTSVKKWLNKVVLIPNGGGGGGGGGGKCGIYQFLTDFSLK